MIQQSHSWGEKKKPNSKKSAPQCSQKHYLQLPRQGSGLSAHQQMWIKKMWYVYTMEYYSAIERNAIWPFATTQWTWRRGH